MTKDERVVSEPTDVLNDYIERVKYEFYMTRGWKENEPIFTVLDTVATEMKKEIAGPRLIDAIPLMEDLHNHYAVRDPKQNALMDEVCMIVLNQPVIEAADLVQQSLLENTTSLKLVDDDVSKYRTKCCECYDSGDGKICGI